MLQRALLRQAESVQWKVKESVCVSLKYFHVFFFHSLLNTRLFDCTFYDADAWVCMSQTSGRRYDHIEYEDGTILGDKNSQCVSK